MPTDYYALLGVDRDATADQVKRAYRKLARELHPDVSDDPETHERFKQVTAAYEVLSDPQKREMYDLGHDPLATGNGAGGGFGTGFSFTDVMDMFFGQNAPRGPRSRTRRGQDGLVRLEIDLADAVFGAEREVQVDTAVVCEVCKGAGTAVGASLVTCPTCSGRGEVQNVQRSFLGQVVTSRPCPQCHGFGTINPRPCPECSGDGRVRARRTLTIKVPAGVDTGTRLQLAGMGEVGPGSGPSGDVYVDLIVRPHPIFTRRADDLHATLTLPMTSAALGTSVQLETFDGSEDVDIRPGTQHGQVHTLRGHGMPRLRGSGRGDLHVHVEVAVPTKLDERQEELLRELAELRGEEQTPAKLGGQQQGLLSRLRDAFKQ